jgi:uncharacterized membrane protein
MKAKPFTLIIVAMAISLCSFSQDVKQNIKKAITNPSAKENAAKADVYHHQKAMKDSANLIAKPSTITSKKSKKSKSCFSRKRTKLS